MEASSRSFKRNARAALLNDELQQALGQMKQGFVANRANAIARLPEFEALRAEGKAIKEHTLENLDFYLEHFEARVTALGGHVHWCRTAAEARETVLGICRDTGARTVTKGKSMIGEEIGINDFLEGHGIEPIETDLGEYIIQLRREPPSHIIAPAIHVTKQQVADAFYATHSDLHANRPLDEPRALVDEARAMLRQKYLDADVGITGANFLIAETGSTVIVTNEGNGDLTQILPRIHVVIASLEKVVPTLEDASTILRLLARSATGQEFSTYTTFSTGPRRPDDPDGPEEFHVVLLDNGRSALIGTEVQDILRCIRCGACMNHCPVYGAIGGHAYGWVYPGPMGAVLTPMLIGVEEAGDLPNASTFCGRCAEVCPMGIPLPKLMRHHRAAEFETRTALAPARLALAGWAFLARRPGLYRTILGMKMRLLGAIGRRRGGFRALPFAGGWTRHRDFPAPEGKTFQQRWDDAGGAR